MTTPIDKIPSHNTQNDIGDLNDPLVKEVINDIHNSKPVQREIPQSISQSIQQPMIQQPMMYQEPIQTSYINYDILTKSIILSIIAICTLLFIPYDKIHEIIKIDFFKENEIILKIIILTVLYYFYNIK